MYSRDAICITCKHRAAMHYTNLSEDAHICTDCIDTHRSIQGAAHLHEFKLDNILYLEMKHIKEKLEAKSNHG